MSSDILIIVGFTVAGGVIGGVRGLQLVAAGGYAGSTFMRHAIQGAVLGLVLGLLISELNDMNLW